MGDLFQLPLELVSFLLQHIICKDNHLVTLTTLTLHELFKNHMYPKMLTFWVLTRVKRNEEYYLECGVGYLLVATLRKRKLLLIYDL